MRRIFDFKQFVNESASTLRVYRGVGRNMGEGTNDGFHWVAVDKSVATQYAGINSQGEFMVSTFDIPAPQKIFKFPYRTNVHVRGSDIGNLLVQHIGSLYEEGRVSEERANEVFEKLTEYEAVAGDELEYYHTKINKPGASALLAHIFELLGYDAIEVDERGSNNEISPTYGLIDKRVIAAMYEE